jgi:hypothetical protein
MKFRHRQFLHQCTILPVILILLLSEGQESKAWDLQAKQFCFGYRGAVDKTYFHIFHASGKTPIRNILVFSKS